MINNVTQMNIFCWKIWLFSYCCCSTQSSIPFLSSSVMTGYTEAYWDWPKLRTFFAYVSSVALWSADKINKQTNKQTNKKQCNAQYVRTKSVSELGIIRVSNLIVIMIKLLPTDSWSYWMNASLSFSSKCLSIQSEYSFSDQPCTLENIQYEHVQYNNTSLSQQNWLSRH